MSIRWNGPLYGRELGFWIFHGALNGTPSLTLAFGWMGVWRHEEVVGALASALAAFILVCAVVSYFAGPVSLGGGIYVRALRAGMRIGSGMGIIGSF